MSRRSIFAGLAALAIVAFTLVAIFGPARDRHSNTVEVIQAVDDQGQPVAGASTIIIERGGHGFFPVGIFFIPLGILFFFAVLRLFRGPRFGGPGPWHGNREEWLNEWHRRQHAPASDTGGTPISTSPSAGESSANPHPGSAS